MFHTCAALTSILSINSFFVVRMHYISQLSIAREISWGPMGVLWLFQRWLELPQVLLLHKTVEEVDERTLSFQVDLEPSGLCGALYNLKRDQDNHTHTQKHSHN